MSNSQHAAGTDPVEPDVDLDLDAEDARLREAVGQPTTVRFGGEVVHIAHIAGWSSTAMKAGARGDWDTWANEVIDDEKELKHYLDADLQAYQIEAIFDRCGRDGGVQGKPTRSGRSSRRTQRR